MKAIIITSTSALWDESQKRGVYSNSTIYKNIEDVGFIHATNPDQTIDMLNRHFSDRNDLLLLVVDLAKVQPKVKFEAPLSGSGGIYPHIYGKLNCDAIVETIVPDKNSDGKFEQSKKLLKLI